MGEPILHQRENSEWSEQFLKDNGKKFEGDCVTVLRLLYRGMRLTAKNVNDITGMADGGRRLRDIIKHKKECKKAVRYTNGKKEGVEYWLEIQKQPTKQSLQEWLQNYQREQAPVIHISTQQNLFNE